MGDVLRGKSGQRLIRYNVYDLKLSVTMDLWVEKVTKWYVF